MTVISERTDDPSLVEHELALKVYLDSLLFDEQAEESVEDLVETQIVPQDQPVMPVQPVKGGIDDDLAILPEWCRQPFESLMFTVGGFLSLAIPLSKLNGIIEWPGQHLTNMPGHSEWFLGLISHRGKQVKVIDIAKFVIPENHKARAALSADRKFGYIILIKNNEYGLVCDGLGEVMKLAPNDVRWRDDRSKRPWLAGTVTEKMCAMLDIDHFSEMLKLGSE